MKRVVIGAFAGLLMLTGSWGASLAQAAGGAQMAPKAMSLGTVQVPDRVMADGKPLPAGTYSLRLTTDMGSPVVGETPGGERWVEFVRGSAVKGRELATVITKEDLKEMKKPLNPGVAVIADDPTDHYLRIWVTQGGTSYVVYLVVGK